MTQTEFVPLVLTNEVLQTVKENEKVKKFKTRKAVENYCAKHRCLYAEQTYTFYR